jgi:hypothetical protein
MIARSATVTISPLAGSGSEWCGIGGGRRRVRVVSSPW